MNILNISPISEKIAAANANSKYHMFLSNVSLKMHLLNFVYFALHLTFFSIIKFIL